MAQAIDSDEKVARFRQDVLPALVAKFRPSTVLVFGSRARGDAVTHSDLDVLIVSSAFEGVRWLDRAVRVYEDCDVHLDVELLCYTPEEYARKVGELGIVRTATAEGVAIVGRPPGLVGEARRPGRDRMLAWWAQAERDLDAAEGARRFGHHEWACFAAQQGAEKAVKALHLHLGGEARGHAVASLLRGLAPEVAVPSEFEEKGRALDRFYVDGAPFEHYGPLQERAGDRLCPRDRCVLPFSDRLRPLSPMGLTPCPPLHEVERGNETGEENKRGNPCGFPRVANRARR